MSLDQYAYAEFERGQRRKYWDNSMAYWRKHRVLQNWMSDLWVEKGMPYPNPDNDPRWGSMFNGVELELEWNDIQRLESDILDCRKGFTEYGDYLELWREADLKFCIDSKEQMFLYRKRVFYYPSW